MRYETLEAKDMRTYLAWHREAAAIQARELEALGTRRKRTIHSLVGVRTVQRIGLRLAARRSARMGDEASWPVIAQVVALAEARSTSRPDRWPMPWVGRVATPEDVKAGRKALRMLERAHDIRMLREAAEDIGRTGDGLRQEGEEPPSVRMSVEALKLYHKSTGAHRRLLREMASRRRGVADMVTMHATGPGLEAREIEEALALATEEAEIACRLLPSWQEGVSELMKVASALHRL